MNRQCVYDNKIALGAGKKYPKCPLGERENEKGKKESLRNTGSSKAI
jgi:hypothetical protein